MMKKRDKDKQVIFFIILLAVGIFLFDLSTSLGIAAAVPYTAVILLSLWLPKNRHTIIAGTGVTILTILGIFLSPPGEKPAVFLANRLLSLIVIWTAVIFVLKYKHSLEVIQEHADALNQANMDLKKQSKELKRSNEELEQFAYMVSHDLHEPLRMVSSYTQLLARRYKDKIDNDANDFISHAVEGTNRMQWLINDLLNYSRIQTNESAFEEASCCEILGQVKTNLQIAIEKSSALITNDFLPTINANPVQMMQLFQNLLDNAIKFAGELSPRIHVSADKKDDEWVFSVNDKGIGIDPQFNEHIFLIFKRLHDREKYPGTGIGLAVCKRIVERHGGRIWVESGTGNGTTFYFTMPATAGREDA
jgi:light-regulated signal transduction histidine kinase (bacteriophytochrome)